MMSIFRILQGFLLLTLLGGINPLGAQTQAFEGEIPVQIFLESEVIVDSRYYKLSEIAQLEGADPMLLEKLANVQIGRSPLPGGSLVVNRSLILSRLRKHIKKERILFPELQKATIRRAALRITGDDIDKAVLTHLENTLEGGDMKPKLLSKSRDIFLPRGELTYEVKSRGKYKKEGGYRNYEVAFSINGKVEKKVPVRVHVKVYKEVYVAKDTIKRDKVIQDADLQKLRMNVDRLPTNYVTDKSKLVGKVTKRPIGSNEVLHQNAITTPPLVKTGDQLLIVYETNSLRLTTPGIAMSKGRLGERISVRNLTSKTIVQAEVKSSNQVQVY